MARFGDNMREVAVTEGDKVAAQIQFGYSVNGFGIGDLVEYINATDWRRHGPSFTEYEELYAVAASLRNGAGKRHASLREAAKIELGLRPFS